MADYFQTAKDAIKTLEAHKTELKEMTANAKDNLEALVDKSGDFVKRGQALWGELNKQEVIELKSEDKVIASINESVDKQTLESVNSIADIDIDSEKKERQQNKEQTSSGLGSP